MDIRVLDLKSKIENYFVVVFLAHLIILSLLHRGSTVFVMLLSATESKPSDKNVLPLSLRNLHFTHDFPSSSP